MCHVEVAYTTWRWSAPRGGEVCYIEVELECTVWRWSVPHGDGGGGEVCRV